MPKQRLSVVVTRRLPEAVETRLSELFDVQLRDNDIPMSREELAAAMRQADVLVPTLSDKIDANLIAQAGERIVQSHPDRLTLASRRRDTDGYQPHLLNPGDCNGFIDGFYHGFGHLAGAVRGFVGEQGHQFSNVTRRTSETVVIPSLTFCHPS